MKGHIAQRYGELVRDLWSGMAKTVAPLKLRVGIADDKFSTFYFLRVSFKKHCGINNLYNTLSF